MPPKETTPGDATVVDPNVPAKEPSLPPNSPAVSSRGMIDWPSAARPQDLDLGTELTHAKLDAMHANNNDRFTRLERLLLSQTTTTRRSSTPAVKELRRSSLSITSTIEAAESNVRDKEASEERTLVAYVKSRQEALGKLVKEFVDTDKGRVIKSRQGDWEDQGKAFVAKVKKELSMPGEGVVLTTEEKDALPEDEKFFMNLKVQQYGLFYLHLCKVLYPNTKKVKVTKKAGEKRTRDEAEDDNDDDAAFIDDTDVVEKAPRVSGRGRGGGRGRAGEK